MSILAAEAPTRKRRPRQSVRTMIRDGALVRVKRCGECGVEKVCTDEEDSEFGRHARWPDGTVRGWDALCKPCQAEASRMRRSGQREKINALRRARYDRRIRTDAEFRRRKNSINREAQRRWLSKPENAARAREANIAYHRARREADKEEVNEENRMYYALRKERAGEPLVRRFPTVVDGTAPRLPLEPFRTWMLAYRDAAGIEERSELARNLGMTERRVSAVLGAEQAMITMDVVDRALLDASCPIRLEGRLIITIDDLYPLAA